jgi:hypothetical protein
MYNKIMAFEQAVFLHSLSLLHLEFLFSIEKKCNEIRTFVIALISIPRILTALRVSVSTNCAMAARARNGRTTAHCRAPPSTAAHRLTSAAMAYAMAAMAHAMDATDIDMAVNQCSPLIT